MPSRYNRAFLQLPQRAEKYDRDYLVSTFVEVGELFTLLSTRENHILYGRRGTGKSHILFYLMNKVEEDGNIPILIDMRVVGSSGGMYADPGVPLAERATRLLVDTLGEFHTQLSSYVWSADLEQQPSLAPLLDQLADDITQVTVTGPVELERTANDGVNRTDNLSFGATIGHPGATMNLGSSTSEQHTTGVTQRVKMAGEHRHRIHFGSLQATLRRIMDVLGKQVWLLLDEWSEVPLELQPYLADLLRRTVFPVRGIVVKIAAIEQRSQFRISDTGNGYIGIELGADISTSLNLDEQMVFENDQEKAKDFFGRLIHNHTRPILDDESGQTSAPTQADLIRVAFTQRMAFEEFVRSAEGVPRDAIHILSQAALSAGDHAISVNHIRDAANKWYTRAKESAITHRPEAQQLLRWIVDEVIRHRKARAFLLRNDAKHELIDFLFDERLLHVVKQNVSSHDQPGVRFNVYSIDYGCYVDLINTASAPLGLYEAESDDGEIGFVQVPVNDYRSIRRAILDLGKFEDFLATGENN